MSPTFHYLCLFLWTGAGNLQLSHYVHSMLVFVLGGGLKMQILFSDEALCIFPWWDLQLLMQASFFISYVVTTGWTSLSSELFQLFPLICNYVRRIFARKEGDDLTVPSFPYESEIPRVLFFGLLGITYFFLAPLILPFVLVYFCMGYLIFRNQVCQPSFSAFN